MYYNITSILVFTLLLLCLAAVAASPQYKVTETVHEDELSTVHEDELSNNTIISRRGELRAARAPRPPCSCADGQCGCCTGFFLEQLNVNVRQRGCMNITYDPDEFAFGLTMRFNDRVLYQNTVSGYQGKQARPRCVIVRVNPETYICVLIYDMKIKDRTNVYGCFKLYFDWPGNNGYAPLGVQDCFNFGLGGIWIKSFTSTLSPANSTTEDLSVPLFSSSSILSSSSSSNSSDLTFDSDSEYYDVEDEAEY